MRPRRAPPSRRSSRRRARAPGSPPPTSPPPRCSLDTLTPPFAWRVIIGESAWPARPETEASYVVLEDVAVGRRQPPNVSFRTKRSAVRHLALLRSPRQRPVRDPSSPAAPRDDTTGRGLAQKCIPAPA